MPVTKPRGSDIHLAARKPVPVVKWWSGTLRNQDRPGIRRIVIVVLKRPDRLFGKKSTLLHLMTIDDNRDGKI